MQTVIINVPNFGNPQGVVNGSIVSALIVKAYKNGKFIPKNATNGDMITAMFPNISVYEHGSTYSVNNEYNFNSTWWNAPYKAESEE